MKMNLNILLAIKLPSKDQLKSIIIMLQVFINIFLKRNIGVKWISLADILMIYIILDIFMAPV